jgi:hypothetical protein
MVGLQILYLEVHIEYILRRKNLSHLALNFLQRHRIEEVSVVVFDELRNFPIVLVRGKAGHNH